MDPFTVERLLALTPEAAGLLEALDRHLGSRYTQEQQHGLDAAELFQPHVRFFVVRMNGALVGCGGIALFDGFAEVKRMFTAEAARRRGVASALLTQLEAEARAAGMEVLRLETGIHQPEAIALYERAGFTAREPFGDYATMTSSQIATSLFYEKTL